MSADPGAGLGAGAGGSFKDMPPVLVELWSRIAEAAAFCGWGLVRELVELGERGGGPEPQSVSGAARVERAEPSVLYTPAQVAARLGGGVTEDRVKRWAGAGRIAHVRPGGRPHSPARLTEAQFQVLKQRMEEGTLPSTSYRRRTGRAKRRSA